MSKRSKIKKVGLVGVSLLAGCTAPSLSTSGGTAPMPQPSADAQQQAAIPQGDVQQQADAQQADVSQQAGAQTDAQQPTGALAAVNQVDREFATNVARANAAEIALSQLAVQRASTQDVRSFAQRMVTDHTQAGQQLQQAATQAGLTLPQDLRPEDQAFIQQLSSLSGEAFDEAYMTKAVQSHEQSVTRLQTEISQGQNPAIQGFARQILPTVQDHLRAARELAGGDEAAPTS